MHHFIHLPLSLNLFDDVLIKWKSVKHLHILSKSNREIRTNTVVRYTWVYKGFTNTMANRVKHCSHIFRSFDPGLQTMARIKIKQPRGEEKFLSQNCFRRGSKDRKTLHAHTTFHGKKNPKNSTFFKPFMILYEVPVCLSLQWIELENPLIADLPPPQTHTPKI